MDWQVRTKIVAAQLDLNMHDWEALMNVAEAARIYLKENAAIAPLPIGPFTQGEARDMAELLRRLFDIGEQVG